MTKSKPSFNKLSLAIAGLLTASAVHADPDKLEAYLESYSIEEHGSITVHVSIPADLATIDGAIPPLVDPAAPELGDGDAGYEFMIEVFKASQDPNTGGVTFVDGLHATSSSLLDIGDGTTPSVLNGNPGTIVNLGDEPSFLGTNEATWPWSGAEAVVTISDVIGVNTTEDLDSGIYQLKVCLGGRVAGVRNAGGCNADLDQQTFSTSFTVRPKGISTKKILVVDNHLTRVDLSPFSNELSHPLEAPGNRNVQALAAWLDQKGYDYDAMSSLDIEGGIPDNYSVVIIADRNSVWTADMRTAFNDYIATKGHNAMILGGETMHLNGAIAAGELTVTTGGDSSATALSADLAGTVTPEALTDKGLYTINNATHWAFNGLTVANADTFGETTAAITHRIVGPVTDGAAIAVTNGVPATQFAVGAVNNYDVIAYAVADDGFALPGVFQSGSGGWIFNAATANWAEGLTDFDGASDPDTGAYTAFALTDATTSAITKTVLDVMLADGAADTDEDGTIDFFDNNPNDKDDDGIDDSTDNCPVANADQADLDEDGIGNICDTDRDGDGVNNDDDAFPDDKTRSAETPAPTPTPTPTPTTSSGGGALNPALWLPVALLAGLRRRRK